MEAALNNNIKDSIKAKFKKIRPLLLICGIGLILYAGFLLARGIWLDYRCTMPTSHVFVCDNPKHDSDFETWLKQKIGKYNEEDGEMHLWVPTTIIIKNGYISCAFPSGDARECRNYINQVYTYDIKGIELPNFEISNLDGERKSLKEIFSDNSAIYIFEIHWIDCPDCKEQDEKYTDDIYAMYGTKNIYRYYLKSEKDKVAEKYKE